MIHLLLIFLGIVGLFSTGPGGRHDWMRFHADEVPCPKEIKMKVGSKECKIPCSGNLKWFKKPTLLKCDTCNEIFRVIDTEKKS